MLEIDLNRLIKHLDFLYGNEPVLRAITVMSKYVGKRFHLLKNLDRPALSVIRQELLDVSIKFTEEELQKVHENIKNIYAFYQSDSDPVAERMAKRAMKGSKAYSWLKCLLEKEIEEKQIEVVVCECSSLAKNESDTSLLKIDKLIAMPTEDAVNYLVKLHAYVGQLLVVFIRRKGLEDSFEDNITDIGSAWQEVDALLNSNI